MTKRDVNWKFNGDEVILDEGNRVRPSDYFSFGTMEDSRYYNIFLTDMQVFGFPERDLETVSVPGRNGDMLIDHGRWKNVELVYSCAITHDFQDNYCRFLRAMQENTGYRRLEDSESKAIFRMGVFIGDIQPKVVRKGCAGTFDVKFNCKPQKVYKDGEAAQKLSSPGNVWCDSPYPSLPKITVYGSGTGNLYVGDRTVQILAMTDQITIDSELQDAYRQVADGPAENKNRDISAREFPVLQGRTEVRWDGGIERVEIIPRWWTL